MRPHHDKACIHWRWTARGHHVARLMPAASARSQDRQWGWRAPLREGDTALRRAGAWSLAAVRRYSHLPCVAVVPSGEVTARVAGAATKPEGGKRRRPRWRIRGLVFCAHQSLFRLFRHTIRLATPVVAATRGGRGRRDDLGLCDPHRLWAPQSSLPSRRGRRVAAIASPAS